MKRRMIGILSAAAVVCFAIWLVVLAAPPAWKDCVYSGIQCDWPLNPCIHPYLGIPGVMKSCVEEWYCPEYYWEPCGDCPCLVI